MNAKVNKIWIFFIMGISVLFLTGCGSTQTTSGNTFIGGTEALKMSFLEGSPPGTIVDGAQSSFAIIVKLENVGEADIKTNDGYVKILGLEPGTFKASNKFKEAVKSEINGGRKTADTVISGQIGTVDFGGLSYTPTIAGDINQKVWAEACYNYKTKMASQICVKKDPQQMLGNNKICDVEGEKNPQNSGAPLQITSLKTNFAGGGKLSLVMEIKHVGTGDNFFYPSNPISNECKDIEGDSERGRIHIKLMPIDIGGGKITPQCQGLGGTTAKNEGDVRLYGPLGQETATVYCTVDVSSTDSIFEVPVEAELTYKYLQHIETPLIIRHVAK